MTITRAQFVRGFDALKAAHARRDRLNEILAEGNDGCQDVGLDPAVRELEKQLEERCRDREDDHGPWPDDSGAEGDISLGLASEGLMTVRDEHDNIIPHLTTAEAIWAMWEATSTGPFRPLPAAPDDQPTEAMMLAGMQEMPFGQSSSALARRVYLAMRRARGNQSQTRAQPDEAPRRSFKGNRGQ